MRCRLVYVHQRRRDVAEAKRPVSEQQPLIIRACVWCQTALAVFVKIENTPMTTDNPRSHGFNLGVTERVAHDSTRAAALLNEAWEDVGNGYPGKGDGGHSGADSHPASIELGVGSVIGVDRERTKFIQSNLYGFRFSS